MTVSRICKESIDYFSDFASTIFQFLPFDYSSRYRTDKQQINCGYFYSVVEHFPFVYQVLILWHNEKNSKLWKLIFASVNFFHLVSGQNIFTSGPNDLNWRKEDQSHEIHFVNGKNTNVSQGSLFYVWWVKSAKKISKRQKTCFGTDFLIFLPFALF